ncbi:DUF998 domain-containing protein [Brevibacterium picturae]|uniref:DUF998 domain-containing protein n=1 Tax=Brevibacterium picturae TaxID=260553 RepID=A0ABP4MW24_9MICO
MTKLTVPTGPLLACGVVAGPIYLAVTVAQALTRDGFDPSQHTWNVMTTGDLGWIQRSNLFLAGVLTVLFAVGVSRVLQQGKGARWGPRLLGLYGVVAHLTGAVFVADPQPGFPPGTSPVTTWHGIVHLAARGGGYVVLLAASLLIAAWFATDGRRRGWAWLALAVVPPIVAGVAHEILPSTMPIVVFAVALSLTWVWFTTLAIYLYRYRWGGWQDAVPRDADPEKKIAAEGGRVDLGNG